MMTEVCPQRTAGHCWHFYADGTREFESCCVCPARRNEKVLGKQGGLL